VKFNANFILLKDSFCATRHRILLREGIATVRPFVRLSDCLSVTLVDYRSKQLHANNKHIIELFSLPVYFLHQISTKVQQSLFYLLNTTWVCIARISLFEELSTSLKC